MFENLDPNVRNMLAIIMIVHVVAIFGLCTYGYFKNRSPLEDFIAQANKPKNE